MKRRQRDDNRQPARPPHHLLHPVVEDWTKPTDEPVDLGANPMYRRPGETARSWALRQLASARWREEVAAWLAAHPHVDLPVRERRLWRFLASPGAVPARWRAEQ